MKCWRIAIEAKTIHPRLNSMTVGSVFTVEVHTKDVLETRASMYSHHH